MTTITRITPLIIGIILDNYLSRNNYLSSIVNNMDKTIKFLSTYY